LRKIRERGNSSKENSYSFEGHFEIVFDHGFESGDLTVSFQLDARKVFEIVLNYRQILLRTCANLTELQQERVIRRVRSKMLQFLASLGEPHLILPPAPQPVVQVTQPKKQFVIVLRLQPKFQEEKNWTKSDNQAVGRHFTRLQQLEKDGKLIFAGRTLVKESMGVVILEVETEARRVMDEDEAVKAGIMSAEILPFQTSLMKGN
jgi:uncharacterized protein YciI